MLRVFHSDQMLKYFFDPSSLKGATMTQVATVDTDSLDDAYMLTNHLDSDWTKNSGVKVLDGAQRSTSMGDLIVRGTPCDPGSKHMLVEACGFRELLIEDVRTINFLFK